ncbi:putative sugar-transport ATP-binding protein ABC transporter sugC [Mycobacterium xenopi 3993]|nr:putative sugar-transport ATP-binding protein ABC transporter sugC [Mycobacterium xenopi 3993]
MKVDLVESLGAEKYVYFTTAGWDVHAPQLDELATESGPGKASSSPASRPNRRQQKGSRSNWRSTL